jgi:putative ABC transport system permease protein
VIHSFWKLTRVNLGFRRDHILTFTLPIGFDQFSKPEQITAFYRQLLQKVSDVPGVSSAAASTGAPIVGTNWGMNFTIAGRPAIDRLSRPAAGFTMITPDYFRTFGIPIVEGRSFTEQDAAGALPVAIVNETFAKKYLSGVDPLTQRLVIEQLGVSTLGPPIEWHIVGVCHDVHNEGVRAQGFPEINVPFWQSPLPWIRVSVWTLGDAASMTNSIGAAIHSVDPDLALDQVRTMDQLVDESLAGDRFVLLLFAGFAGAALVLASIGIYGVMSFVVAQRTHELGLRMALGASPRDVQFLVLREGILLALSGLVLGLGGTYFVGRTMKSLLYEITAIDPAALTAVGAVLVLTAILASYLPARRAMRVDPMVALRYE